MTEQQVRQAAVDSLKIWLGAKQGDSRHKAIIDRYNAHKPLARGYAMTYADPWCAATVSVAGIVNGWTDIMPTECGCASMIKLYQDHPLSKWEERDDYTPQIGDIVMYDWDDAASGFATTDNKGAPEHVGMVMEISGKDMTIIEGNINKSVGTRKLTVNGRYIRGYCLPAYHLKAKPEDEPSEWAKDACSWTIENGIIKGDDDATDEGGLYNWQKPITVEQMAVILHRYHMMFN